jgi:hypothetical protein
MPKTATDLLVTDCPDHGVKVTTDLTSQAVYSGLAYSCSHEMEFDPKGHALDHAVAGDDCWACCPKMRSADRGEVA